MPWRLFGLATVTAFALNATQAVADPLSSWNDGPAKRSIIEFVAKVSAPESPDYVPPAERIAVFDNDGTLWAEQPLYFQLLFAFDRVRALASDHPEWKDTQPFKAVLEGDLDTALSGGDQALLEIILATHAGMTTAEFSAIASDWLKTAKHPVSGRLFTEMVYQPMLDLLEYLRTNGFKTYITSGGGIELIRVFAEDVYGIPPEQVIGSSLKVQYEYRDGNPALVRLPEIDFVDDKAGKPVAINHHIGRRPIAAFGNSDGDLQMLQWTCAGDGARLCVYVHHTDAEREWAYDRNSHIGRLDVGLDQALQNDWTVVDMASDWKYVFPIFDMNHENR
ncbi:MAG: haloacid dehalogenase-like hydrolase [Proteobacteria bacterium]|nr:haloacid dehalogenase-like hydrolase [Pseudomonadota bacterium]